LWSFGIFFPFWYVWTKKNLATRQKRKRFGTFIIYYSFAADGAEGKIIDGKPSIQKEVLGKKKFLSWPRYARWQVAVPNLPKPRFAANGLRWLR
jgi:hypothetical protein